MGAPASTCPGFAREVPDHCNNEFAGKDNSDSEVVKTASAHDWLLASIGLDNCASPDLAMGNELTSAQQYAVWLTACWSAALA